MGFKSVVLLVGLLAGSFAVPTHDSTESDFFYHTDTDPTRIVGGTQAATGSFPHMVALSTGILIRSFMCGGSLVTTKSVLTAAHCIDAVYSFGSLSSSLRVTVGTNRWNSGGQTYSVSHNITHEHYLSAAIKNDIGFLITASPVTLSNLVRPCNLHFFHVGGGVVSKVAGWGRIRQNGALSATLLELTMSTLDGAQCVEDVERAAIDFNLRAHPVEPHIEICTFHSAGHGMCNGDSGSALVRVDDGSQIGVVSWGFPCARGAPDIFARISAYASWIVNHIVF